MFQSFSVSRLFPRPPSARGGLRPAGVCSSRHSHNHQHSPAPQYHHLSSSHNHHGPIIIHNRSPQLSKPNITIIARVNYRYICAAPLLSYAIYAFAAGAISDSLIAKGRLSRLNMQKVFCLLLSSEQSHLDPGEHCPGFPCACCRDGAHVLRRHSRPRSDLCRRSGCHFCFQRRNQRRAHPEHYWTCAK